MKDESIVGIVALLCLVVAIVTIGSCCSIQLLSEKVIQGNAAAAEHK